MRTLLPKTPNRRKSRIVVLHAELSRPRGAANWQIELRHSGRRTATVDTNTSSQATAEELVRLMIREITRQPAASSQQPAASSQQPAASSQQPAASLLLV